MKIRATNLLLLLGAFVIAAFASFNGIADYDGSDLSGVLVSAALFLFVTSASLLCSVGIFRSQSAAWSGLSRLLDSEYSMAQAGVHGSLKGIPVFARVESASNNAEYLEATCAMYNSAKHYFALTVRLPYQGQSSWRVAYKPKSETQLHGDWQVTCEDSPDLAQALGMAGVVDLFSGWDKFTAVKCHAPTGELTLRYPAPHRFFCPTAEELENEVNLLRRAADIWQHAANPRIAA